MMAIDTAIKRFTIAPMMPGGPRAILPDGTIDAGDRVATMQLYSGSFVEEPPEPSGNNASNYIIGMGPMGKTRVHPHPLFCRVKQ